MKIAATILLPVILSGASAADVTQSTQSSPQSRPRLDPDTVAAAPSAGNAAQSGSAAVTLSPYIVRGRADGQKVTPLLPIPQGGPAPTQSEFLNAVQSGVLAEKTTKKFVTQIRLSGENGPAEFGTFRIGPSFSW